MFGKTLAQTILQTYFELEMSSDGQVSDNRYYFQNMKIMEAGENYTKHLGQYPVIFLSLKSLIMNRRADEAALKINRSLQFAVVTRCLRIRKESIFTGLNNLKVVSILNDQYAEYFGFTQGEVEDMLEFYGLDEKKIEKPVHEDITYGDIYQSQDNLWNFLFFTGYLKAVSQRFEVDAIYLTMQIPNMEIRYIYRNIIDRWFERKVRAYDFTAMHQAILEGNTDAFEQAVLLEIKHVKTFVQMEAGCEKALEQIEEKNYAEGLLAEGYQKS